jgi:hypothetical protein
MIINILQIREERVNNSHSLLSGGCNMAEEHEKYFLLHHQEIERHSEALKKLEGTPEKIDAMDKKLDSIIDKLDKTELTYLRTDVFAGERTIVFNELNALKANIKDLYSKHDKYL